MSDADNRSEIDKLLAEVDRMTGDAPAPATRGGRRNRAPVEPAPEDDSLGEVFADASRRFRTAAMSGAVAGAMVWALFAVLPFLRATSGAVGAFLATFVVVLVLRRR